MNRSCRATRAPRRAVVLAGAVLPLAAAGMAQPWALAAQAAATGAPSHSAVASAGPERLGTAPVIVRGAHRLGPLASSAILHVDVMLSPRSGAALQDYATNVSSPGNSLFRHYLTVRHFASRFGPTASAIRTVESSLRKAGLRPGRLAANHLTLPVTASAGQFARAFSTEFQRYRLPGGRVGFANTRAPMFPAAAAQHIQAVIGLDTLTRPQPIGAETPAGHRTSAGHELVRKSPQVVTGGPQPCQTAVTDASADSAYTADQLASAYNFSDLYGAGDEGAGVTVGVFEQAYNLPSDIAAYQTCYGTDATVKYTLVDGGAGSSLGYGSEEAALDIEDIIGLAPQATIDVYQSPNTNTALIDEYTAIVDNSSINVVSTSWATCELIQDASYYAAEATLFEQAATEGQSVFASSGDTGSTCLPYGPMYEVFITTVADPASQPYVTGVGGTSLTSITGPAQTVWNDSSDSDGAGGGAVSSSWAMPAYQSSAPASLNVVNANSSGSLCSAPSGSYCREVPDVSASADPLYGYLIYYDGAWSGVGGTSAAAPLWAAFASLTDASAACDGTPIGFANPTLYQEAADNYSADFFDITTGDNDYTPDGYTGGLYPAGSGYDMASGLGTPNGASLPQALCTPLAVTVTSPGNQIVTVGVSASLQITAADSGSGALTFKASGMPPGLSISSAGLISGTPTAPGTYPVTVTATDPAQVSGAAAFTITVNNQPLYAAVSAAGSGSCSDAADTCTLTTALATVAAGGTIELMTPGGTAHYVGNWSIGTDSTSAGAPVTIEAAPGLASEPVLDGNDGASAGCSTGTCDGPVLTVPPGEYVTLSGITITGGNNTTSGDSGGIYTDGNLTVTGSTFTGNTAYWGGAIDADPSYGGGTVTVTGSTFAQNSATADGGAIDSGDGSGAAGSVTVTASTFAGNTAGYGGAIASGDNSGGGSVTVTASTFAGNTASVEGPVIDSGHSSGGGTVAVAGDLFDGSCDQAGGTWHDGGYNAGTGASCFAATAPASDASGGAVGSDLQAALTGNGGPTQTIAPTAGNPAIGLIPDPTTVTAGSSQVTLCPATDQRGYTTPKGAACNAGAVQTTATPTVQIAESAATATYGHESALSFTANVRPPGGNSAVPAGTVHIKTTGGKVLCTITLTPRAGGDGAGSCALPRTAATPGHWTVQGIYSGDIDFTPATSSGVPLTIAPAGSSTSLSLSKASVSYGSEGTVKFTATVTPQYTAAGPPAGTVTVAESGTTLCTITLASGTGSCTMLGTRLPAGAYKVTGRYAGDADIAASASPASTLTIAKDTSATSLKLSKASVTYGSEGAEHLTVQVKSPFPGAVTGKVTITAKAGTSKPVQVCVITLKAGTGTCTLPAKALKPGTWKLTASYGGSTEILTSDSPAKTLTVSR